MPSMSPTVSPTMIPTEVPSSLPSQPPSGVPSARPSVSPSPDPTVSPSWAPTVAPTVAPSYGPSRPPSGEPSGDPSALPSGQPSRDPTHRPSSWPTSCPSAIPSSLPTVSPTGNPTQHPTHAPTFRPSVAPSASPTQFLVWFQAGTDINGGAAGDHCGSGVSLSKDGTRMAVGSPMSSDFATNAGQVRVFEYNNTGAGEWSQLGGDIFGEAEEDRTGTAVSLSRDGSRLAIGADKNDGSGANAGHVRVFEYTLVTDSWVQMGFDIDGEAAVDLSGRSVSLSDDGDRVAIGGDLNDVGGVKVNAGHVRVFEYDGSDWVQLGGDMDGESADDRFGISVSLSGDGATVAVGAFLNDGSASNAGHVRMYGYAADVAAGTQQGADIDGDAAEDRSGYRVSLSDDGHRVAISSHRNDAAGADSGSVRVFEFQLESSSWQQLGGGIGGEAPGDLSGWSLSLSGSGERVAVGSQFNADGGVDSGHVRVFEYLAEGDSWVQVGSALEGEATGDTSGFSVSLSGDGNRLAIGAPLNDAGGTDAGHVRVYQLPIHPTGMPSGNPSASPSTELSVTPSVSPTPVPTSPPSLVPSGTPSGVPSGNPSAEPTPHPTPTPTPPLPVATPYALPAQLVHVAPVDPSTE